VYFFSGRASSGQLSTLSTVVSQVFGFDFLFDPVAGVVLALAVVSSLSSTSAVCPLNPCRRKGLHRETLFAFMIAIADADSESLRDAYDAKEPY
jgi:hypothetical protein